MFYCDDCAEARGYPTRMFRSFGKCELCCKVTSCNDVPSAEIRKFDEHKNREFELSKLGE